MGKSDFLSHWQATVRAFAASIAAQPGHYGVEDLCRFLLEEPSWKDRNQVLEYLKDYLDVSQKHHTFHAKWSQLRNMANAAEHDRCEMKKVQALIETLKGQE